MRAPCRLQDLCSFGHTGKCWGGGHCCPEDAQLSGVPTQVLERQGLTSAFKSSAGALPRLGQVSCGLSLLTPPMLCIQCQICTARQLPTPVGNKHGAGHRARCTILPSRLSQLRGLHPAISEGAGCLLGLCREHLAFSHSSGIFGHGYRVPVEWQEGPTHRSWPRIVGEP